MNGIQGVQQTQSIAQMFMNSSPGQSTPQATMPFQGGASPSTAITNADGQSLFDLRDEMKGAAEAALESYDGSTDLKSHIQGALESTLEENGFSMEEVRSAMESSGGQFSPMGSIASSSGLDPAQLMQQLQSGQVSGTGDSMIQSFLEQFRAGLGLDMEI